MLILKDLWKKNTIFVCGHYVTAIFRRYFTIYNRSYL